MESIRILLVVSGNKEVNIKSAGRDPRLLKVYGIDKWPTLYTPQDLREIAAAFASAALIREAQDGFAAVAPMNTTEASS
jgi:hypothetical protein